MAHDRARHIVESERHTAAIDAPEPTVREYIAGMDGDSLPDIVGWNGGALVVLRAIAWGVYPHT